MIAPGMIARPRAAAVICIDLARAEEYGFRPDTPGLYIDVGTTAATLLLAAHAAGLAVVPGDLLQSGGSEPGARPARRHDRTVDHLPRARGCAPATGHRRARVRTADAAVTAVRRRPETLLQGVLLASVGGYLDALTFVRFGVFANAQTGNVVLLGVDAAAAHWHAAFVRLTPVLVFVVGVMIVEQLGRMAAYQRLRRPLRIALGVEIVGLAIAAALPDDTPKLVVIIIITLVCSIQFSVFRTLVDTPYSTLLASGNLRTMAVQLHKRFVVRDASAGAQGARFAAVVVAFAVGAAIGALLTKHLGNAAAAVPAAVLAVTLGILIWETSKLEHAEQEDRPTPP